MELLTNDNHQKLITEKTLVPLSVIAVLTTVVWIIAHINATAQANQQAIRELEELRLSSNKRIYDRLNIIDKDIGELKASVSAQSGKLDLLIELQSDKK